MTKKTVFNFIKTPCGQAKYIELEANKRRSTTPI